METIIYTNLSNESFFCNKITTEIVRPITNKGQQLLQQIEQWRKNDSTYLSSLRFSSERISQLQKIETIILVGSSGVGKSTLQRSLQSALEQYPELGELVSVPQRVVTCARREDDSDEIIYVTREEFDQMAEREELGLYGIKRMESGREEKYGYLKPEQEKLPIYFANNGVLKNPETVRPERIFDDALIITIYAPDRIRRERVEQRSPHFLLEKPGEFSFRFSDEERPSRLISQSHITLKNFGYYQERSISDLIRFTELITTIRR